MHQSRLRLVALDLPSADERSLIALHVQQNSMQRLNHADSVPITLEARLPMWRNLDPSVRCWVVWNTDASAIIGNAWTEREDTHTPIVNFNIMVLPAYRRRGIGQLLLAAVAEYAHAEASSSLITQTSYHRPEGEIWMRRIGAEPRMESRSSRLTLAEVDHALLTIWLHRAAERAAGYALAFWQGMCTPHTNSTHLRIFTASMNRVYQAVRPVTSMYCMPSRFCTAKPTASGVALPAGARSCVIQRNN